MANRYYYRMQGRSKEIKLIVAEVTIGATGAPTLVAGRSYGVTSIVRNAAGDYDVVLQDLHNRVVGLDLDVLNDATTDLYAKLAVRGATGNTFSFFTLTAAAATDPPNPSTLLLRIWVKNSILE